MAGSQLGGPPATEGRVAHGLVAVVRGAPGRRRGRVAGRTPRAHRESGSSLLEFAVVAPILMLILLAIIDFGSIFSNQISVRQGVREGARQGAVAQFGSAAGCLNSFTGGMTPSSGMQNLMCLVKNRVGITPASSVYTKILFDPTYATNSGLVVCVLTPAKSVTGLTSQLLGSTFIETKVEMSIEQTSGAAETAGEEAPPSGSSWAWCTASGSTP
ncbi:MAG: TadE/TadG family type IV pilus assembly protein [Acidimicrobiales bacterium]